MSRLNLTPDWIVGDLSLTESPYSVDQDDTVDVGEPAMVVEENDAVAPNGVDGTPVRVVGYGNREYALTVYVEGGTLDEVAYNEAVLRRKLQEPNLTLTHYAGDPEARPSVYVVKTARLTPLRIDEHEAHLIRKFELEFVCAPFARSVDLTTVDALPVGETPINRTLDACTSPTPWKGFHMVPGGYSPQVAASSFAGGTAVAYTPATDSADSDGVMLYMERTGALDLTDTPYLVLSVESVWSYSDGWSASLDGVECKQVAIIKTAGAAQFARLVVEVPAGMSSASKLQVHRVSWYRYFGFPAGMAIHDVSATNQPPGTSPRQQARVIEVGGTERTAASIRVESPTSNGLGVGVLATCPDDESGYAPPLYRHRVSGNDASVSTEATSFTGQMEAIHPDPIIFEQSNWSLPPGDYVLVAALRSGMAGTFDITWSTSTRFPPATSGSGGVFGSVETTFYAANTTTIAPLAMLSLPTIRNDSPESLTAVGIEYDGSATIIKLEEAWLFRVGDGCAVSIAHSLSSNLWLESPDSSSPVPTVWTGATRGTARHPGSTLFAMGTHILTPGRTKVFTASSLRDYPRTSATYYKRWHTNAAE